MTKQIANILTGCRILGSILLLFFPAFSAAFYIIYLFCAFSDMIDGTIARKTNAVSSFGSKLDAVADFVFMAACVVKLLPMINIPVWIWIWITVIAIIKFTNIVLGFVCRKELVVLHTVLNKTTGLLLFILPLTLQFIEPKYSFAVVCAIAIIAAIQESYYTIKANGNLERCNI